MGFLGETELVYYIEFVMLFEDGLRLDAGGLALGLLFLDIVGKVAEGLSSSKKLEHGHGHGSSVVGMWRTDSPLRLS